MTATPVIKIVVDSSAINPAVNQAQAALSRIGQGNAGAGAQGIIQRLTMSLGGAGSAATQTAANTNTLNSAFGSLGATSQAVMSRLSGMGGAIGSIGFAGAALGATALVGGLVALASAAVNASAQFEAYRASLTTVLGDSDKASQAFDRLTDFAAKTPFSLDQSVQGFIKLKALGLQPTEAAMMSYGNTASAMGKDLNQMIEAVADASTGEFERLKEFGIKSKNQGDTVAFTFQGVTKTVGNNSKEIQDYLMAIGNVQFAGAMEKQMQTFNGALSNLEDTWTQTLAAMGDNGLSKSVASVINMITNGLTAARPVFSALGNAISGVIDGIVSIASGIGTAFSSMLDSGGRGLTFIEGLTVAVNLVGEGFRFVGAIAGASFGAIGQIVGGVAGFIRNLWFGLLDTLGITTSQTTSNMGLSFVGVLRAAKFLASNLPKIFSTALGAVGGMFSIIGKAISRLLSGDWNAFNGIGGAILGQFSQAAGVINGIADQASAIAKDSKGAAQAWERLKGNTGKKGGLSLDDLAGSAPKPAPASSKKNAGDKSADQRAKREKEFWEALQGQVVAAGMLSNAAEVYNKELEYRKIVERDLLPDENKRIANALKEINSAKAITGLKQNLFEAQNEYTVELGRAVGLTETQRGVEDTLFKSRLEALNKGVDINSDAYKLAESDLRKQLEKNAALKEQNDLLAKAGDFARRYSSAFDITSQLSDMDKQRDAFIKAWNANGGVIDGQAVSKNLYDAIMSGFNAARQELKDKPLIDALGTAASGSRTARAALDRINAGNDFEKQKAALAVSGLTPAEQQRALREITQDYNDRMLKANRIIADDFADTLTDGISEIGKLFGGVFGKLADSLSSFIQSMKADANGTSGISRLFTMISGKLGDGFKEGSASMMDIGKGIKNLGDPLKDLKATFGKGGDAIKGIGQAVGGAMQGYQMGSQIGGIMQAIGLKGSGTGAKIGGAVGGITGNPLIAAGASIVGGLISSLFYKAPYGTAKLSGMDPAVLSGNKSAYKNAASGAAGSVQAGLADIAERLGGVVGSFDLAIGQFDGKWRVRDTTTGWDGKGGLDYKGNSANGLHDFGSDAEAAIKYAIQNAIQDGAITGISDLASKALKTLSTDAAISLAEAFKAITDELDSFTDPIGAAVREINSPLDALVKQMQAVGASSTDLAKIEEYRTKKLNDALKEQLSGLSDFMKALYGDGSGVSALDRYTSKLTEFSALEARIKAGDSTVDQSAFTQLGQELMGLGRDVLGGTSTSAFQDLRNRLIEATQGFEANITTAFGAAGSTTQAANDATRAAIETQTSQLVAQQVITNDLLRQLVANQNTSAAAGSNVSTLNGRVVNGDIY